MATTLVTGTIHADAAASLPAAPGAPRALRIVNIAIICTVGAMMLGCTYLYERDLNSVPLAFEAVTGTGVANAAASPSGAASLREMHIANDGLVFMRGAQVTSVSGSTITVSIEWGSADFKWAIKTNGATSFFASDGEKASLNGISVGHYLSGITGQLDPGAGEPTVTASFVRS